MCTPAAPASVESTMAVLVVPIADASPDTMLSVNTLPSSEGSMAEMLSELPRMSTGVTRTSVTSVSFGSFASAPAACVSKSGPCVKTMKSARSVPSIALLVETRTESVSTATQVTSARPIMSAAAVSAVRRGLRRAFSPARRPAAPRSRRTGHPITVATGTTSRGASSDTPRNTPRKPPPMSCRVTLFEVKSPATRAAQPRTKITNPSAMRRRGRSWVSGSDSDSAATGAMRVARRAGRVAAMTVTMVPTSTATMNVRGSSVIPVVAVDPNTDSNARAMRMPTPNPSIDATNPVTAASTSTDVITCARVAPKARSSANSRVRWATRMLNVLMIRKLPTNSEMNAKTSSGVPMNVLMVDSVLCSAAAAAC